MARESLRAHVEELLDTYRETVRALAAAVELRDKYTGGHIERVAAYALSIAREFEPALTDDLSFFGYMLHDVGELTLPGGREGEDDPRRTATTQGACATTAHPPHRYLADKHRPPESGA